MDRRDAVRALVAQNPNTPIKVLQQLARDRSLEVKRGLINNPSTPVATLEVFAQKHLSDRRTDIRIHGMAVKALLARRPEIGSQFLARYATCSPSLGCILVALHPAAPSWLLEKNYTSHDWIERYAKSSKSEYT